MSEPHSSVISPIKTSKTPFKPSKVVIGMSGGVDSSVAAWMLKQQGYEVIGLFMKNWEDDDSDEYCSARQDWLDVVSVADLIGIDVEAVNFAAEYRERVFADFLREYAAGRTPNPDVLCNAEIKFKAFLDHAMSLGADAIATGHYARVRREEDGVQLLKAIDVSKDQSYFLHRLTQSQLEKVLFPLGEIEKIEVRKIAQEIGLHNARKKDSTGICFIGERPFREFLNRYLPRTPGPIKTVEGKTVGEHMGLAFFTLGQRKGIGLGGSQDGTGDAWYVARKDVVNNTLYVAQGHEHPWLLTNALSAMDASWIAGSAPLAGNFSAKTRYRQTDSACEIQTGQNGDQSFQLQFPEPQWAVTPGQSAVLYDGEICLGGGIITT
ncbi:tRNA 2-thiouridine(34) synthase MnmA [Polynucleobacter paneuropaeus]|uniref:tRNA-specific 2-thiouridylase MnmA n=1 Tax=Polynucleobacter paneuropaeus TaxID=2527775 RepID=A0ABX9FBB9_9BURK|nr:tRNA 2-thiouridine(34) synthase MnmA [Polynucleobacter paneuropaeus]AWW44963.1 tRNA 2-thiouridine(34) synthase MnmA [Polynucleobacter paneuropaeus]AWW46728.1 tRNA 2-thiouridine(34) synthase MnmA [Polynucleobacter paneuropaeus]MBT8526199.1 tRNA 2-thiouridine(34) synthase MnmA [Polynucleobacter paneuropaeus]MBT8528730.1 tRNA 2-thiouridine(34) synthase MnmA [Polynucleobacter paneuropaeus]MBT8532861.1 tRNA 2-thiouridine(34) synthase MnmA [Polynucleobacter paneuropaeus]